MPSTSTIDRLVTSPWARLRVLLGSQSALSAPVIIGFGVTGFLLALLFIRLTLLEPWPLAVGIPLVSSVPAIGLLLLVSRATGRRPWSAPRLGLVAGAIVLAGVVRAFLTQALIGWLAPGAVMTGHPIGRTVAVLVITTGITLGIAGVVQLTRERSLALAALLAEQRRLRRVADSIDEDLLRAERDLRARARDLLDPTIAGISTLLAGELSETAAQQVSAHISAVASHVVRPISHDLARAHAIAVEESVPVEPMRLRPWSDRMDVTTVIHPVWVLILCWLIVVPVLIFIPLFAVTIPSVGVGLVASVAFGLFLFALRRLWPPRWRSMRVASALAVLAIIYVAFNILVHGWIGNEGAAAATPGSWDRVAGIGLALKVGMAMVVSIVAMLAEHGQQNRAMLEEVNLELEGLIARLRRETWLLHRSVSLAVHGPLQSALVSTAMRLSSPSRTEASVADARQRLDAALVAIEHGRREVVSLDDALADLRGLWQAVVGITSSVDEATASRLEADAGLRQCVIEICREATSNAIRHGMATEVRISITSDGDVIEVRVADDGVGVPPDAIAGLGMGMYDDTCLRWTIGSRDAGGAELTASIV